MSSKVLSKMPLPVPMYKAYVLFLILSISISCKGDHPRVFPYALTYHGALKGMMRTGDISAKADLRDFEATQHLYALGAIDQLKGEILILDSQPYNTQVTGDSLIFNNSFDLKATLLVTASVSKWQSVQIPESVMTMKELEKFVASTADEKKLDADLPFPFLIEGLVKSMEWHVIDWKEGDTEHSHEKHINSGLNGRLDNTEVIILGFYSEDHKGIFTHHTSNTHMHVKLRDGSLAGHADNVHIGHTMVLKLPSSL